jgi:ribosomal protein L7/L12
MHMDLKKKKPKKINLLEMPDSEKIKVIREVRENLRQKIVEAKLWKSFIEAENLTINGSTISCEHADFKGLSINDILKSL